MPSRVGTATRAEAGLGMAVKDLIAGGSGLQLVRATSATRHLSRIDQAGGGYLSTGGA